MSPDPDWRTPAERSEYRTTPDLAETMAYLDRLAAARPDLVRVEEFGRTGEGRPLSVVVVSRGGRFEPEAVRRERRVVLLVQNAIHAGEMDGKDACLALLRDLLRRPEDAALLDRVVLLFVPIYNVDGHERRSPYGRINQNGPETFGWRANGTNLNLNRDYQKSDAPETRAFHRLFQRWLPDFFVDDHVTDGADFQYDVTFMLDDTPDVHPPTAEWVRAVVRPELTRRVHAAGHLAFPAQVFLKDETDPAAGLVFNTNAPRFSTGQMVLESRPGLLVELHMLKEYRTRVTANVELLRALMQLLNEQADRLLELNREADAETVRLGGPERRGAEFPLVLDASGATETVDFLGVEYERSPSPVSGGMAIRYGRAPRTMRLTIETGARTVVAVPLPAGYIVPAPWTPVVDVLVAHGVKVRRTSAPWTGAVEVYRCDGMEWPRRPFEGRFPILRGSNVERPFGHFGACSRSVATRTFPAGSAVVSLAQRTAKVAIHWLEPEAPDSALRWGFFHPIFEAKESGEGYVVEALARTMRADDPALAAEFDARVARDAVFAHDPAARLAFFYDRSPWGAANRVGEYPVGRLSTLDGIPLE